MGGLGLVGYGQFCGLGLGMREASMQRVGLLLVVGGAFSYVLNSQSCDQNNGILQATQPRGL